MASATKTDSNFLRGWLLWTQSADRPSPLLKDLAALSPDDRSQIETKLAYITEYKAAEVGFKKALGRHFTGSGLHMNAEAFAVSLGKGAFFKVSYTLVSGAPVILSIDRQGGRNGIDRSIAVANKRISDLSAVGQLAAQHPELKVPLTPVIKKVRPPIVVAPIVAAPRAQRTTGFADRQMIKQATQVGRRYNDLAALLDQIMYDRVAAFRANPQAFKRVDLTALAPIEEASESPAIIVEARRLAEALSGDAFNFGAPFLRRGGRNIPLVRNVFGSVRDSDLKKPEWRSAGAANGLMMATHITEDWSVEADALPYGELALIKDPRAKAVRLAQLGGVVEAQQGLGIKIGKGIDPEAIDLLANVTSQSALRMAPDVVAVKAAASLDAVSSMPDIGIEHLIEYII